MHFSQITLGLAAAGFAAAAPVVNKRAHITDADILNYALTLEHLENTFYSEGLAKFSEQQFAEAGYDATFYKNLVKVGQDESDHVNFLTTALKGTSSVSSSTCVAILTSL
jgi:hypothetical protein